MNGWKVWNCKYDGERHRWKPVASPLKGKNERAYINYSNCFYSMMVIMDNKMVSTVEKAKDRIKPMQGNGVGV